MFYETNSEFVRGASFFGLETELGNTDCSWVKPSSYYINELGRLGFNWIRLPFSQQYVRAGHWEIMDNVFETARLNNISILLDYHRTYNSHQGDWSETNMFDFVTTWETIIDRYYNDDSLQAIGLYNEYEGNDAMLWNGVMRISVQQLEEKYPNRFFWLVGCPQWSGNCLDMNLEGLPFSDRIRYEAHKYKFSGSADEVDWDRSLGPFTEKLVIGEWGYKSSDPSEVEWAHRFVDYLIRRDIRDTFFWVAVTNSGDTGGLWKPDCLTIEITKLDLLEKLWGFKK